MKLKKALSDLFFHFPDGAIKDKIRLYLYNRPANQEFSITKENKNWVAKYPSFELTFSPKSIGYHVLLSNYIFLHHVPEEPIDILVDAGAYIGTFCMYAINKYPQIKKVIALEPDPLSLEKLKKNIELNNLSNIDVLQAGLWDKKDTLVFFPDQKLASSVYKKAGRNQEGIKIEVDSFDNLLKGVEGKRIFIKMNIEGAELDALPGCAETIRNNKVHLAIAADHLVNGELTYKKIEKMCREMNLSVSIFNNDPYITVYASNETRYSDPVTH
ncbi:MAG: FkbM family methyltransferase [Chitinophagaceae bacterium]|nr:FkbM family methyltransferase [Chitinophagaceae bacterium]